MLIGRPRPSPDQYRKLVDAIQLASDLRAERTTLDVGDIMFEAIEDYYVPPERILVIAPLARTLIDREHPLAADEFTRTANRVIAHIIRESAIHGASSKIPSRLRQIIEASILALAALKLIEIAPHVPELAIRLFQYGPHIPELVSRLFQ
jgi:hypothetical protein